jgi:polysaccharide export outer membrane protein
MRGGVLLLGLALAAGCAARHTIVRMPAGEPVVSPSATGELMSATDRKRLEALCAERAAGAADTGYRIGPDDLLEIRIPDLLDVSSANLSGSGAVSPVVAQAPAFQQGVRVNAVGDVSIPLLGTVPAAGLTPTALETEIARRLSTAGILRNPQVSVLVSEYRSRVVAVVGSVERPGLYPLTRPGATLADLIWAAGGPSREAGRLVAFVPASAATRGISGALADPTRLASGAAVRIDLETLLDTGESNGAVLNPQVRPGDLIRVSPAGSVQVAGWVGKPGSYPVTRGLTLSGAVAAAGGHLFPADRRRATLKRTLALGEERVFTVDLDRIAAGTASDFPVSDGDVVNLPGSVPRLVPYGAWELVKALVHVGGSFPLF